MTLTNPQRRVVLQAFAAAASTALLPAASAQPAAPFPHKPITLILPFPAGGATDAQMRLLAQALGKELGQIVNIANQPGVAGTMAPAAMARSAAPDGYTLSVVPATLFRLIHLQKVNYDPRTDFTYLINLTGYTNGLIVRADAKWKTLQELLADAKARPGQISYCSTGIGSGGHIAMERLARAAGVQMNFIPYKGMADETTALLGGHVDVISDPGWGALVESGKARVLATLGDARLKRWPQVPTLKELGYDVTVHSPVGIVGPKGMVPALVKTLHDAFQRAMKDPAYVRMLEQFDQPELYMSSAAYTQYAIEQTAREKVFLDQLGIKLQ
jgi:tripartite-type tricarboxylate transporter receptor subunit TctC